MKTKLQEYFNKFYSKQDLINQRGWTDNLIKKYALPDFTFKHDGSEDTVIYFKKSYIEQIEKELRIVEGLDVFEKNKLREPEQKSR